MSVLSFDARDTASRRARERVDRDGAQLWRAMRDALHTLSTEDDRDALGAVNGDLRAIDVALRARLVGECAGLASERALVLCAPEATSLGPLLARLVRAAPEVAGLAIAAHVPRRSLGHVATLLGRARIGLDRARVRAGFARGHLLDVVLLAPEVAHSADEAALDAAELAVQALLGESTMADWIGDVGVATLPRGGALRVVNPGDDSAQSFPLAELPAAVAAAIDGLSAGLPERPWHATERDSRWTLFELTPSDDPAPRADLINAASAVPELTKAYLQRAPIASRRFSRHGETFFGLSLPHSVASSESALSRRHAIEEALDRALVPDGLGAVIGCGLGVRHTYIDLALTDLPRACETALHIAREHGAPPGSVLRALDTALEGEWLEVWGEADER